MTTATLTAPVQTATDQVRFGNALKAIRKMGVTTRLNVQSCCRSCAEIPEDKATLWNFGGQDNAFSWFEGTMVYRHKLAKAKRRFYYVSLDGMERTHSIVHTLFFYFTDIVAAEIAAACFKAEGFTVEWDGTFASAVVIKL
jgi:hypothetical protein